jgi:hypothetical protein
MLDIKKMAVDRLAEFKNRGQESLKRWGQYMGIVEKVYKAQGRELQEYQKANIAQCCA